MNCSSGRGGSGGGFRIAALRLRIADLGRRDDVTAGSDVSDVAELGLEVPVGEIDAELRRLWAADDARTMASLINLVVYAERPDALLRNSEMIRQLTRDNACRAILVSLDRAAPEVTTRAWITAHCHLAGGRKTVCCEQIAFALTGRSVGRLRNVVFAHLVSDLPLVMWWQGELSARFTERLTSVVDRLVFDSSEWSDPAASFAQVCAAREDTGGRMIPHDIEWSRGFQFRLAVASMFDDPRALEALGRASRLRIVHHPAHRCAALQLLAWFAMRAGWRAGGGGPELVLEADPAAAPLGCFELAGEEFELMVEREPGGLRLSRRRRNRGSECSAFSPADPDENVGLVGGLLARGGRNSLFVEVLPRFVELLEGRTRGE